MRRRLLLLLAAGVLVSCEPGLRESSDYPGPSQQPNLSSQLSVPPNPCIACPLAPTVFTRKDGKAVPEIREFVGDPKADYLLVVQDDGLIATGVEIKLNGELVIAKTALPGFGVAEISKSVLLTARNKLTVMPLGKTGAKVTVWILPGAEVVGPTGGTVYSPGSHFSIVVPAGFVESGGLLVSVLDTQLVGGGEMPWSTSSVMAKISPSGAATTLNTASAIALVLPVIATTPAGFAPYVRAQIGGLPDEYWATATVSPEGAFEVTVGGTDLGDFLREFPSLALTMTAELQEGSVTGALFGPMLRSAAAPLAATCSAHPVSITLLPGELPCDAFPALTLEHPPVGQPQSNAAIVLVEGWIRDVAKPIDLYEAQGYNCVPNNATFGHSCRKNTATPNLPAAKYFSVLLPELVAAFPRVPIYTFTYASYDLPGSNGSALANALVSEAQQGGITSFILVGHSMGGIVSREAVSALKATGRIALVPALITLGTPHNGTPAPSHKVIGVFGLKGINTPGGQSLVSGLNGVPEDVPIYAYGGSTMFTCGTLKYKCPMNPNMMDKSYAQAGSLLCKLDGQCDSDGVVPLASALGTGSLTAPLTRTEVGYNHSQMHEGILAVSGDPLHVAVISDLQSLLGVGGSPTLLAHYPLDTDGSDTGPNPVNGAITSNATFVAGRVGNGALHFTGGASYMEVPIAPGSKLALKTTDQFTTAMWIKPDQLGAPGGNALPLTAGLNEFSWSTQVQGDGTPLVNACTSTSLCFEAGGAAGTIVIGQWHHLVQLFDGATSSMQIYVDGTWRDTETVPFGVKATDQFLYLGSPKHAAQYGFVGSVDDVQIYSGLLSPTQILALANPSGGGSGPVALYQLDGDGNDASGNGNNGVVSGAFAVPGHTGVPGTALSFQNAGVVTVPSNPILKGLTSELTLIYWVNRGASSITSGMLPIARRVPSDSIHFISYSQPGGFAFQCCSSGGSATGLFYTPSGTDLNTINDGAWHQIAVTRKFGAGGFTKLYLDGVLAPASYTSGAATDAAPVIDAELLLGRQASISAGQYTGYLDDVYIFDRILTQSEIQAIQ